MKLNLGSGDRPLPGFVSVDFVLPCDLRVDLNLNAPWPWATSSIEEIVANDILEHLEDRVHTMNEAHRVLRPGGRILVKVPSASHGAGAWQDPTHRSAWTLNSFQYFEDGSGAHQRLAKSYGITARFKIVSLIEQSRIDGLEEVCHILAVLEAVKP